MFQKVITHNSFYNNVSKDVSKPLIYKHFKTEGNLEFTSLLYIPDKAPFDLFEKKNNEIKIFNGKETSDTILVQIPIHFNVQRVQKEIGKVLKDKISKDTSKFNIQTKRRYLQLQIMTLDHFRWSWEFKKKGKYTLEEVWEQVDKKQKTRQEKIKKRVEEYKKTGKGIKQRLVSAYGGTKEDKNKAILISRNIKKANRILENVCKGIFPGEYSDH
jgi:hypothetical protein